MRSITLSMQVIMYCRYPSPNPPSLAHMPSVGSRWPQLCGRGVVRRAPKEPDIQPGQPLTVQKGRVLVFVLEIARRGLMSCWVLCSSSPSCLLWSDEIEICRLLGIGVADLLLILLFAFGSCFFVSVSSFVFPSSPKSHLPSPSPSPYPSLISSGSRSSAWLLRPRPASQRKKQNIPEEPGPAVIC